MKREKIEDQWPDALLFVSEALKAGLNSEQAFDLLSREAPEPMRGHLKIHWSEKKWVPTQERLAHLLGHPSLALAKAALMLSCETGGAVAPVLEKAVGLLKAKAEIKDKVRTLTLQGQASAWVVGLSPFVLMTGFFMFSPEYIRPLLTTRVGWGVLGLAVIMIALGLFFVHRATRLED